MVNKIQTTLTLKEIYNLAENGDQARMKNHGEAFYLKSQFAYESKPEYAWIYLRRRPDGSYPISEARLRIIFPEYKLVEERLRRGSRQITHLSQHQNRRDGRWAPNDQNTSGSNTNNLTENQTRQVEVGSFPFILRRSQNPAFTPKPLPGKPTTTDKPTPGKPAIEQPTSPAPSSDSQVPEGEWYWYEKEIGRPKELLLRPPLPLPEETAIKIESDSSPELKMVNVDKSD
jgi:hypothetical protein